MTDELCSDCPPVGYPTDATRCTPCPRRSAVAPVAVSVKPRPLEWNADNEASSAVGGYRVQRLDSKWEPLHRGVYMLPKLHGVVEAFETPAEAKAYCQSDFNARILSSIIPATKGGEEALGGLAALDAAVSTAPSRDGVSEEDLCKVLVKIWGYKWVEFEDIPLPGAEGRDRIADAYSTRLNAQDAVRGLLRRYIIQPRAAALAQDTDATPPSDTEEPRS